MSSGTFLCPPQIHLQHEDPLNLDKENDKIDGSALLIIKIYISKYMYRKPTKKILAPPRFGSSCITLVQSITFYKMFPSKQALDA